MKTRVMIDQAKQQPAQVCVIPKRVDRPECQSQTVMVTVQDDPLPNMTARGRRLLAVFEAQGSTADEIFSRCFRGVLGAFAEWLAALPVEVRDEIAAEIIDARRK